MQENQLAAADAALASARAALAEAEDAVRNGDNSPGAVQQLEAARVAVASAEANTSSLLAQVFAAATEGHSVATTELLEQVEAKVRHKRLPLEFLVLERSEAEWVALRKALNHERICAKLGDPTDQSIMAALAAFRAHEAVASARTRLEANQTAIESAWNAATVIQ